MITLHREPQRVLPFDIPALLMPRLVSGRVRAVLLPLGRAERLEDGDCLWCREGFTVSAKQPRRGVLRIRYAGDAQPVDVAWPGAMARPCEGSKPAQAMPRRVSRMTLVVGEVRTRRLAGLSPAEAIDAGLGFDAVDGVMHYFDPLVSAAEPPLYRDHAEAMASMWQGINPGADRNPELVWVGVRPILRNIADLFPGVGSGGVG